MLSYDEHDTEDYLLSCEEISENLWAFRGVFLWRILPKTAWRLPRYSEGCLFVSYEEDSEGTSANLIVYFRSFCDESSSSLHSFWIKFLYIVWIKNFFNMMNGTWSFTTYFVLLPISHLLNACQPVTILCPSYRYVDGPTFISFFPGGKTKFSVQTVPASPPSSAPLV